MTLTDYQKKTVEHLCEVFDRQHAYLVADEVGLGKTFVARGLIEKGGYKRIIYIASNAEIALQNGKELSGSGEVIEDVDRLSMLPSREIHYEADKTYILLLSPVTSFTGKGSPNGNANERKCLGLEENESSEEKVRERRKEYCWLAVSQFMPDLIILDEFHRFNGLIDPGHYTEQHYSIEELLQTAKEKRGKETKILLLSATPYSLISQDRMYQKKYERGATSEDQTEAVGDDAFAKPFSDFDKLTDCICTLSGCDKKSIKTPQDYYEKVMCRTERMWLRGDSKEEIFRDMKTPASLVSDHLIYRSEHIRSLRFDEDRADLIANVHALKRIAGSESMALHRQGKKAIQGYSDIRTWLDETPEYLQFSEGYRSPMKNGSGDNKGKESDLSDALCKLFEVCPPRLDKNKIYDEALWDELKKHAKLHELIRLAIPEGAELRLWVPPVLSEKKDDFSKTVVFAHYRMSTRAIAALSSMEAERRLSYMNDQQISYPEFSEKARNRLNDATVESLIPEGWIIAGEKVRISKDQLPKEWISSKTQDDPVDASVINENLKKSLRVFWTTDYVLRALYSYAVGKKIKDFDINKIIPLYCDEYKWDKMLEEYMGCLSKFEEVSKPQDLAKILIRVCGVFGWEDRDRTRISILPDWREEGYLCGFGERYTRDYSDKGAHDRNEDKKGKYGNKCVTTKRLDHIRERFQSPFYPFVLAASETAQEGVNLQNYCATVFHWSVPSRLNTFTQEDGRVDRRDSITIRRQALYVYQKAENGMIPADWSFYREKPLQEIYGKIGYKSERLSEIIRGGLFPHWFLPTPAEAEDFPKIGRMLFAMPGSRDEEDYEYLRDEQEAYGSFGIKADDISAGEERSLKEYICPLFA